MAPHLTAPIGSVIRELRLARGWSLRELAGHLGLSTSRLSELERGAGSFSAEALLEVFRLFGVGPEHFLPAGDPARDPAASLTAALVRLGADHLAPPDRAVVHERHRHAHEAIVDTLLLHPHTRLLTALPAVLLTQGDEVSFPAVQHAVAEAGAPFRFGWLLDATTAALLPLADGSTRWRRTRKRTLTRIEAFLLNLPRPSPSAPWDLLDPDLRSTAAIRAAERDPSAADAAWRTLSRLQPGDFTPPLEHVRDRLR